MKNKVILVSIDGMRPDGVIQCGNPYVEELMKTGSYTLEAKTVMPSVFWSLQIVSLTAGKDDNRETATE